MVFNHGSFSECSFSQLVPAMFGNAPLSAMAAGTTFFGWRIWAEIERLEIIAARIPKEYLQQSDAFRVSEVS